MGSSDDLGGTPLVDGRAIPVPTVPVLDFPTAWGYQRDGLEHRSTLCSAVQTDGGMLCDCGALYVEYTARVLRPMAVAALKIGCDRGDVAIAVSVPIGDLDAWLEGQRA